MAETLIQVKGIKKHFPVTKGLILTKVTGWIKAVDGIDFSLYKGETFGLVGESGCGKTTTGKLLLREEKPTAGSILFKGKDLYSLEGKGLSEYRRSILAVFQDPYSSLNPRMRVRDIIAEPLKTYHDKLTRQQIKQRVAEVLEEVGLNHSCASLFPHEFSGGQRQRIAVARALAPRPECIILDEPVSALDLSVRAQVMTLLKDLQKRLGVAYMMIAHDLAVVKYLSHRMAVMYLGKIVESAVSTELYSKPLHPYTKALLSSALPFHPDAERKEIILPGEVPGAIDIPPGCRFHSRCSNAMPICSEIEPALEDRGNHHEVACHLH